MALFGITFGVFALAFAGLAVGVMLTSHKELQGSCGGPDVNADCCQTCPEREACDEVSGLDLTVPPPSGRPTPAALAQLPSSDA